MMAVFIEVLIPSLLLFDNGQSRLITSSSLFVLLSDEACVVIILFNFCNFISKLIYFESKIFVKESFP